MYEIKNVVDKDKWEAFTANQPEANFLQSWQWGEFHKSRGKSVIRRGVYKDKQLVGVYVGQVENARRGKRLEIAGGPIINWEDDHLVEAVTADIKEQARKHNAVFARIRPQLPQTEEALSNFKRHGFKKHQCI